MMNRWTLALAAAGVVGLGAALQAEEAQHAVNTAVSSTTLSGYVDTSAIWKLGSGNANLPGRTFDTANKQDGFNLNSVKLSLAKPLDEGQWSAGYAADLMFGPDAQLFREYQTGAGTGDQVAVRQAYAQLRAPVGNGLDFKVGVFDTVIGYESLDTCKNPNYSSSYGYAIEPIQHTGVLMSYNWTDWLNTYAGVANTVTSGLNERASRFAEGPSDESEKTYMGGFTLTAPESMGFMKGATLSGGVVNGLNGPAYATDKRLTQWYVGVSSPTPWEKLSVGAAYDYRANGQPALVGTSYANAVACYLSYQATEKLKLNNRFEYASGTAGTWGSLNPNSSNEEFIANTFTLDYSLWANVLTRAEFRWDHDLTGNPGAFGGFGGSTDELDSNSFTLAFNVVYMF